MAKRGFEELLAELKAMEAPAAPAPKLLVKSGLVREIREDVQIRAMPQTVLGEVIKARVDDAVRTGRLSGTAARAGLAALGLDAGGATAQANVTAEQQRAAIDHQVRLGKLSGSEAMAQLRQLGLEP